MNLQSNQRVNQDQKGKKFLKVDKQKVVNKRQMSVEHKLLFPEDQLANMIALYESYLTNVQSNLISSQQMQQKGDLFLQWVNNLLAEKLRRINQIAQHSIEVFRHLTDEQLQLSHRFMDLENQSIQKSTIIQNHLYTIRNLENKLNQRDNNIDKLRLQISELTQKIQKQQSKFKRQAKQFKKTFRIIQENTQNDKQMFDSIQLQYEYERNQKDMLKNDLQLLTEQHTALKKELDEIKRLLKGSENKLQWEIKKKISLEDVIKQKNQLVQKLLIQIADLKSALHSNQIGIDSEHLHQKYFDDGHKPSSKNILSEDIFRESFSQVDMEDQHIRKHSLRKSFDEISVNALQGGHFDYVTNGDDGTSDYGGTYKRSVNGSVHDHNTLNPNVANNNTGYFKPRSNKNSFYRQQAPYSYSAIKEEPQPKSIKKDVSMNRSPSPQSTHINQYHDQQPSSPFSYQNRSTSFRHRSSSDASQPQIRTLEPVPDKIERLEQQSQEQDKLQIITQKVQSSTEKKDMQRSQRQEKQEEPQQLEPIRRYAPDLYFAHFLLTSQSVKIKEDCEQMLNIDVKQYYPEVVEKRVPMHIWDEWIRDKLKTAVKAIKERYNQERRTSMMRK